MDNSQKVVSDIESLTTEFSKKELPIILKIKNQTEKLHDICSDINASWSGSTLGYHGSFYYGELTPPPVNNRWSTEWGTMNGTPDGWNSWDGEIIRKTIEKRMGKKFEVKKYNSNIKSLLKEAKKLKTDILIELSQIDWDGNLKKEKSVEVEIESFELGDLDKIYADFINPKLGKVISRDMAAMTEGRYIPAHMTAQAGAYGARMIIENIEKFLELVDRFNRQAKKSLLSQPLKVLTTNKEMNTNILENLHPDIYKKCHELYKENTYAEAVEKGFKVVRDRLRKLTGYETGSEAFGKTKLYINGASAPNVDKDFNEAVKFLTMAIDRFRNEKSHTSDAKIEDPIRAYEYLTLSSLAMKLLDNSEIKS